MTYTRPQRRSIALKDSSPAREYRTFEDWQAEQALDGRTPEERGINVGSPVMWRHRTGRVIVTDRATVVAIADDELTLLVKDVEAHTCQARVCEIVDSQVDRPTLDRAKPPTALPDQIEAHAAHDPTFHLAIPPAHDAD